MLAQKNFVKKEGDLSNEFPLRPSAYLCALCVKELFQRRERRDTQRTAEETTASVVWWIEPAGGRRRWSAIVRIRRDR